MVDIIVVNWNSGSLLKKCVDSVLQSNIDLYKIIIIDNASNDYSLDSIVESDKVKIIKSEINLGFGKACNLALRESTAKYVLLLNPDAYISCDTLLKSELFMENNPEIGVMGCMQINEERIINRSCSRFPQFKNVVFELFGFSKLFKNNFINSLHMTEWDHKSSMFVDHVIGSYYFCRKEIFCNVGFFDENYFLYYEDLDLSKRIREYGYKIYYNSDICIFHEGGGTSKRILSKRIYYSTRSRLYYYKKHMTSLQYIILKSMVLLIELPIRVLNFIVHFKFIQSMKLFGFWIKLMVKN